MLNFIDGSDVKIENVIAVLYGQPNIGKTSLALTAKKPILLDFDGGVHRAGNRKGKSVVPISDWSDVAKMTKDDLKEYDTIVVDTLGKCLDYLSTDILRSGEKGMGASGVLYMKGYGVLKSRFKAWLNSLTSYGLDVVLIAHMSEDKKDDTIIERIIAVGSSRQEVYQQADIMGRISFVGKERILAFDPTEASFGKNVGLANYVVKSPEQNPELFTDILATVKELINGQAESSQREHDRLLGLKGTFEAIAAIGVDELNATIQDLIDEEATPIEKKLLVETAMNAGFSFDKKAKKFIAPAKPESENQGFENPATAPF